MSEDSALGESQALDGDVLVLKVAYDGTDFSGFAAQSPQQHVRTVAGELERALKIVLRRPCDLVCAGRTDAGVHALGQYVSVPLTQIETEQLANDGPQRMLNSLNALLPKDISIREMLRAPLGFSARFDAQARHYRYRIICGSSRPIFTARWVWWIRQSQPLNIEAMQQAANYLIGEHDFITFCKAISAVGKPTHRYLERVDFCWEEQLGERQLVMDIVGNAFLHNMVRAIMGTLVEVGRDKRSPQWVDQALRARDRTAAGPTAPASGLTFWDVRYPHGLLAKWQVSE